MEYRLSAITLDEASVVNRSRAIEQEREVAIYDLLDANLFKPEGSAGGPYHLTLGVEENRLVLDIRLQDGSEHAHGLPQQQGDVVHQRRRGGRRQCSLTTTTTTTGHPQRQRRRGLAQGIRRD